MINHNNCYLNYVWDLKEVNIRIYSIIKVINKKIVTFFLLNFLIVLKQFNMSLILRNVLHVIKY